METAAKNPSRSAEVAQIIIEQLGKKCLFMLGACNLIHGEREIEGEKMPGLSMKIKGSKVAYIIISLDVWDQYNMRFLNRSGNLIQNVGAVGPEELHTMITKYTGLYTSL